MGSPYWDIINSIPSFILFRVYLTFPPRPSENRGESRKDTEKGKKSEEEGTDWTGWGPRLLTKGVYKTYRVETRISDPKTQTSDLRRYFIMC